METNVIKVQFLKNGEPGGREYTYYTPERVDVGEVVEISLSRGVVTEVDVPVEEIALFGDAAKTIIGRSGKSAFSDDEVGMISKVFQNYYCAGTSEIAEEDETAKSIFEKIGLGG